MTNGEHTCGTQLLNSDGSHIPEVVKTITLRMEAGEFITGEFACYADPFDLENPKFDTFIAKVVLYLDLKDMELKPKGAP